MDEEITIQSYTASRDASAQEVLTWGTYAALLARVQWPEAGVKETYSADQQTAFRRIVFWLRYDGDIHEKMRIVYGLKICDIIGIRMEGRQRYTVITCQMRDNETIDYLVNGNGIELQNGDGATLTPG